MTIDRPAAESFDAAREVAPPPKPAVVTAVPTAKAFPEVMPTPKPVEPLPVAASIALDATTRVDPPPQTEALEEEELRERIRLAAQRAIAAVSAPEPPTAKTAAPKIATVRRTQAPAPPPRPRKTAEPKIFVPPRAPDDPGPEPSDGDGVEVGPPRPA